MIDRSKAKKEIVSFADFVRSNIESAELPPDWVIEAVAGVTLSSSDKIVENPCPACKGTGSTLALLKYRDSIPAAHQCGGSCRIGCVKCGSCGGSGELNPNAEVWKLFGAALRRERRPLDLIRAAKALGCGMVELSKAERGEIDPKPFLEKVNHGAYNDAIGQRQTEADSAS